MSEKEILSEALDNSANQDELNLSNSNSTCGLKEKVGKRGTQIPLKDNDDSDNDFDEDILTQSYGEISLEEKLHIGIPSRANADKVSDSELKNGHSPKTSLQSENAQDSEEDVMTASYGEISLDHDLNCDKNSDSQGSSKSEENLLDEVDADGFQKKRPDSLVLSHSNLVPKADEFESNQMDRSQQTSEYQAASADLSASPSSEEFALRSSGHARTGSDTSGLSELQGTLVVDGDLVTFVAEDLQEKIKMSSPVSQWPDSSFPGSRSSTPSLYRQALQPSHHIIDPNVLTDLETHAKKVATCVDSMLENLSGTLQSISSLTVDCMETYESSVCRTCDSVDVNIKEVYKLMAKSEELNNSMTPLYKIAGDIKHIKKMLDQLEQVAENKS